MTSFLDYSGSDPADAARKAGAAFSRAKHDIEKKGVKSFLFNASSVGEFDERARMRDVSSALDEVANKYLNEVTDGRAKLARSLRREFADKKDPCGGCPSGSKCVCTHEGCVCKKESAAPTPPLPPDIEGIRSDAESAAKEQARKDVAQEKARRRMAPDPRADAQADARADAMADARADVARERGGPQHDHDDPPGVESASCPACRAKYGYPPMETASDPRADAEAAAKEQARRDVGDARRRGGSKQSSNYATADVDWVTSATDEDSARDELMNKPVHGNAYHPDAVEIHRLENRPGGGSYASAELQYVTDHDNEDDEGKALRGAGFDGAEISYFEPRD